MNRINHSWVISPDLMIYSSELDDETFADLWSQTVWWSAVDFW